jgi:hypothetical protein
VVIPNGANTGLFRREPESGPVLWAELGLGGKFGVVYAGIHSVAQGLEMVLEAAQQVQGAPEVHFLFVGEGPKRPSCWHNGTKWD